MLRVGGKAPSHYVGAEIPILGTNANWEEKGEWFVAEGDESDGTLVNFHPEHAILLNVEAEHLDFYDGIDAICACSVNTATRRAARSFTAARMRTRGACARGGQRDQLRLEPRPRCFRLRPDPGGAGTEFTVRRKGEEIGASSSGSPVGTTC